MQTNTKSGKVKLNWQFRALSFFLLAVFVFTACKKEDNAIINIYLTDAPVLGLEAVFLDIQSVEVNHSEKDTEKGWTRLQMNQKGAYNLLSYTNGKDTLLATLSLSPRKLAQIKLIPGPDNRVVDEGKSYTLSVTSILASGIRLPMELELESGKTHDLWVDVDASRSLVRKPNNQFILEPRARVYTLEGTGSVKGYLEENDNTLYIALVRESDTLGALPDEEGNFLLRGVPPGTWSVLVYGPLASQITNKGTIEVIPGNETEMGTINLE